MFIQMFTLQIPETLLTRNTTHLSTHENEDVFPIY